ncbi:MAG: sugar kinase [Phycisphaeraceae bacterium]|nr:sugar kinase [Phycisphaeraceae bacterium]
MALICTGTIGIDTVYTPHGHREKILGGSCTYFAAAASFYGPVRIVAAAGDDFPAEFHKTLKSFAGIDTTGLEIRKGSKTFAWGGKYLENMNSRETLFTELGVLGERPPEVPAAFADSQYIFLANSHPGVQLGMLNSLPKRRFAVADTMDLWINIARAELDLLLTKIDGLVLNYDEAELLTGKSNTVAAARAILHMGPKFVVVKKGEHGCLLVHKDGIAALPAYPTETVIDPTGAGDSFAGGMMGHIASHGMKTSQATSFNVLRESLAHGTVIASFNIESFSLDRLSKLTRAELDKRYAEYVSMVRV